MPSLEPGTVVAGYRIESLVGRGGMGVVYRAFQLGLERIVALKVIAPELLGDEDIRKRFLAEARAAASVDHPNVIPVHEAGAQDGLAYIAMRYVAGSDLRSLVRAGGALDPVEAAGFVAQAAAALDAIHRAGFVHRDVKPANLLVDPGGHVYLTDFGLAKQILTRTGGTRTGQWVGTLDYIAPEQIRGGHIDARADVYALGGVLHYALTGRVPFVREGDEAKLWAQLSAPPPVPSSLRRGLHAEFDAVLARAMAKAPDERYPSTGDLGRAAQAAARGTVPSEPERLVARGAAAPGVAPTEEGLALEAGTRTSPPPRGPRRRAAAGLAAGAAIALVAAVVLLLTRGDDPGPVAATATPTPTATRAYRVTRIDGVGRRPAGIAYAGDDVWVVSGLSQWLTRVATATSRERGQHTRVGFEAREIVAYRDDVWVAETASNTIMRIDARSGGVRARIPVPTKPIRLSVDESGVWVGTEWQRGGPGQLQRFDPRTGKLRQTIVVNEGVGSVLAAAGAVWVVKDRTNKIARLLPGESRLADWATLPGKVRSLHYGGGYLWATYQGENAIARVGVRDRSYATASAGNGPTQAVLAGGRLFVACRNDQAVNLLDPRTLKVIGRPIAVGLNPYAMVADDRSVWVTGLGDNTLTRIDYR
jgi:DNA-binding beta-propeller fold protein YncE